MQIIVRDNNVEQALRALKKKLQREGVYREMKLRRHYETQSEKRARERAAAIRRARKLERKRAERESARLALRRLDKCPSQKQPIDPTIAGGRSRSGSGSCSSLPPESASPGSGLERFGRPSPPADCSSEPSVPARVTRSRATTRL